MAHEVFVSHSSIDKAIADAVTASLEQAKIRCWIAPRDILPGESWGGAIVDAIEASKVMVIIFSANSNGSKQVMREVERAVQKDVVVVPFRVEEVQPSKDMEYFLSATHWLDALTSEMDGHLRDLVKTVQVLLNKDAGKGAQFQPATQTSTQPPAPAASSIPESGKTPLNWKLYAGLAAAAILTVGVLFMLGGGSQEPTSSSNASNSQPNKKPQDKLLHRKTGSMKLKLPKSVIAAEKVLVSWSGESGKGDRVSVAKSDSQDGAYLYYTNVGNSKNLELQMPDQAGVYEVRYRNGKDRTVIERQSIKVTKPDVNLVLPKDSKPGSEVLVQWQAPNNKGDYLAVAGLGSQGSEYVTYGYTRNGSPTKIRIPDVAGEYELRYISALGKSVWASEQITVPQPEASLSLQKLANSGENITIDWQGPANKGDYVTVVNPGQAASEYLQYVYAKVGKKAQLKMPEEAGTYEIRYISGLSKQNWASQSIEVVMPNVSVGQPENLIVGNEVEVPWQGPANKSDYLAVAELDSDGDEHFSYKYVKPGKKTKLFLPDQPGDYVLRYIAAKSKAIWAELEISVAPRTEVLTLRKDTIAPGKKFGVKWQQKGHGRQYVAIYKPDADVKEYESYRYTKRKTSETLTAPTELGSYEIRYISGKESLVWATIPFEVKE